MTSLLSQVYDGIVAETEYIAERQKAESDRKTNIALGKRGFTRPSGFLAHDLRLNNEAYGDTIRQGIISATDKVEQLALASYTSQQEYDWLEHQRLFGEQKQQIEFDGQKTIVESENVLQRDLSSIRLEAERGVNIIDLSYSKQAKEIDIRGDAASSLLSTQYSIDTEMAVSAIEVANELAVAGLKLANEKEITFIDIEAEKGAQLIDIKARGEAQGISLGYEKESRNIKNAADIKSMINEQQARIDVAIDLGVARNKAATDVGEADVGASGYLGGVKNEGFAAIAQARSETAVLTGQAKRSAVRITHSAKAKAVADESSERLKNLGLKQERLLNKKRELNQSELDALRDTNTRRITELKNLDGKRYTALYIRNAAELQAEIDLAKAKFDANLEIVLAKPALIQALNSAYELAARDINTLEIEIAGNKSIKKLKVINDEASQRFKEASDVAFTDYVNVRKINSAEQTAEATAQIGRLANVELKSKGKKDERDTLNKANFNADKDVSLARIAADSLRYNGQNDALDITFAAQDYANSKRLNGRSTASKIRMIGRANLQLIEAADKAIAQALDLRAQYIIAKENQEQTHTEYLYDPREE